MVDGRIRMIDTREKRLVELERENLFNPHLSKNNFGNGESDDNED